MAKVEIAKPVRFTIFFILFLTFVLLGVKACNDQKLNTEVAEIEELLKENTDEDEAAEEANATEEETELKTSETTKTDTEMVSAKNSEELSDFKEALPAAKKEKKKKPVKASATINVKAAPEKKAPEKKKEIKKAEVSKKTQAPKNTVEKTTKPKMTLKVSGANYKLDDISNAKLKGAIRINKNPSKIEAVGFIGAGSNTSPIVKANEIKSTLIRLGVSTKVEIKTTTEEGEGYGEVRFY